MAMLTIGKVIITKADDSNFTEAEHADMMLDLCSYLEDNGWMVQFSSWRVTTKEEEAECTEAKSTKT